MKDEEKAAAGWHALTGRGRRRTRRVRPTLRRGFSLAELLLLVTVVGILLGAVRNAIVHQKEVNWDLAGMYACFGVVTGLVVGIWIGCLQARRIRALAIAVPTGAVAGGVGGAFLLAVPGNLLLAAVGAAILILLGAVVRLGSAQK